MMSDVITLYTILVLTLGLFTVSVIIYTDKRRMR